MKQAGQRTGAKAFLVAVSLILFSPQLLAREASFMPPPSAEGAPAPVVVTGTPTPSTIETPVYVTPTVSKTAPAIQKVTEQKLSDIDPDAMGLLSSSSGGLGDSLWDKTPRAFVEKLLPQVSFPTESPALNGLARRMLLTVAAVPKGEKTGDKSLAALRGDALVALGDVSEAWQLMLMRPDNFDEESLRSLTEAAIIGPDSKAICEKMPDLMAAHNKPGENAVEWQKALLVCQYRAGDINAVQLGLDMMREQEVKDDLFLTIMNNNVIGGNKRLPRQLTPLRATTLALLRQLDVQLPSELYGRPDASLIHELLQAKTSNEKAKLALAEKAASKGLLTPTELASIYRGETYREEALKNGETKGETGGRLHALLFQLADQEQIPNKRIEYIEKLLASYDPAVLNGTVGQLLAQLVDPLTVATDHNAFSATAARILALAGKPEAALSWLKLAHGPAQKLPGVASTLQSSWPLFVLSGLVTDTEYGQELKGWMDTELASPSDAATQELKKQKIREARERVGNVLALFSAAGYAVPDTAWLQVAEELSAAGRKMPSPSPILTERLRASSAAGQKGETILLSLLLGESGVDQTQAAEIADIVRALRQVGLSGDAQNFAREAVTSWLYPASAP